MIANFAAGVAARLLPAVGASLHGTTPPRRDVDVCRCLLFFNFVCLPAHTHTYTETLARRHTDTYTHILTLTYVNILCSFAVTAAADVVVIISPPAHTFYALFSLPRSLSLSLLCYGRRKCFCFWFICGNPLGFVAIAFAFMFS